VKAPRLVLLAAAGTAMLALTGCTQSGNVAARVGDTTVPTSDVDFLTRMQCISRDKAADNPQQGTGATTIAKARLRTDMVNALVQGVLNRELAESKHVPYDKTTLRGVMEQFEADVQLVPAKDRDHYRDLVEGIYRGLLPVYALAESELAAQGVTSPQQTQVDQAVAAIQADYRKKVDIEINPEYGASADGIAGAEDPSLSLAVSSFAKKSRSEQPDSSWVSSLPADQRCG
jgi:hypothetical protein